MNPANEGFYRNLFQSLILSFVCYNIDRFIDVLKKVFMHTCKSGWLWPGWVRRNVSSHLFREVMSDDKLFTSTKPGLFFLIPAPYFGAVFVPPFQASQSSQQVIALIATLEVWCIGTSSTAAIKTCLLLAVGTSSLVFVLTPLPLWPCASLRWNSHLLVIRSFTSHCCPTSKSCYPPGVIHLAPSPLFSS